MTLQTKKTVSLEEAIQEFLVYVNSIGRRRETIISYSISLKSLLSILGNVSISKITDTHLAEAVIYLASKGARSGGRSPSTMNRMRSIYRSFLGWCFQSGRLSRNPAIYLRPANATSRRTVPIQPDEMIRLLSTIKTKEDPLSKRDFLLFSMYVFTGIRRNEALFIKIRDYNSHDRLLNLMVTKGGKPRTIVLPEFLALAINDYIAFLIAGIQMSPESYIFPGRNKNNALTGRQAQLRFDYWKEKSGIRKELTIQSLRAGFANIMYRYTEDRQLTSKLLGHSETTLSKHYIYMDDSEIRTRIEQAFRPVIHGISKAKAKP